MDKDTTHARKLTAIMFIDMVGYTAMMQKDEKKTQIAIQHQRDIIVPIVESYGGEVLRYTGDGTLCTFESAIYSVNAAVEIQRSLLEDKLMLRIGIHIGDIVSEEGDIYGDGVNLASKLEPLAPPGGICISETVYDNIKNRTEIECVSIGQRNLKNVKRPMEVYALTGEGLSSPGIKRKYLQRPMIKRAPLSIAAVVIVIFFAKVIFNGESSISEVTAEENSLAVLFIENMADPADADRSAEMIRNLLSTDLTQSQSLRVIGSQRLYDIAKQERKGEGQLIDRSNASEVARKAGAQWMLTGNLARIGNRMVLTTEIENVRNGKVLDAQRADGGDIFSLVDALSIEIRSDMGIIVSAGEIDAPIKEITTNSSEAYQQYLEGLDFLNESSFSKAIGKFNRAVKIDSTFTKALYNLAVAQWWFEDEPYLSAKETVKKILLKKKSLAEGELLLVEGLEAQMYGDYSRAKDIYQRLLLMYPDDKEIHYGLGEAYWHSGTREYLKALDAFEEALNLDPEFRLAYGHIFNIYQRERMDDRAIRVANRLINSNPDKASGYRRLADVYGWKGDLYKSIKNYEKAAELNKGNFDSVVLQGWAYRIGGKYEEALNKYAELSKPDVPAIWQYRGKRISSYVYAEQGQYKKAIQLMREAVRIGRPIDEQNDIRGMMSLAGFYLSSGDTIKAFSLLDSALAMNPGMDLERFIYSAKGSIYAGSRNQEEVKKLIDTLNMSAKQIRVFRSWEAPKILKMKLFRLQGNNDKAMVEYNKLGQVGRLFNLEFKAILYGDANDWENVVLTTDNMEASFLSRNVLNDFRRYNYPRAFYIRGKAYEEMGKPGLAIENYEALLDLWKYADEEIPERKDTIKRLAALKQES